MEHLKTLFHMQISELYTITQQHYVVLPAIKTSKWAHMLQLIQINLTLRGLQSQICDRTGWTLFKLTSLTN